MKDEHEYCNKLIEKWKAEAFYEKKNAEETLRIAQKSAGHLHSTVSELQDLKLWSRILFWVFMATIAFSGYLIKENSNQRKEIFLLNNQIKK